MVDGHVDPSESGGPRHRVERSTPPTSSADPAAFHTSAIPEDLLTTESQRRRRTRILDAAVDVARVGGYDRVHMRDVAVHAGVSLATVYHYFPSKVHLLVLALERELVRFDEYLNDDPSDGLDPYSRLRSAVWDLINGMEKSDRVTEALSHAYVASHATASVEAELVRRQTSSMFAHVMNVGYRKDVTRHLLVADLVTDVWTCEVLALVQGRRTYAEMRRRLSAAIDLFARSRPTQTA